MIEKKKIIILILVAAAGIGIYYMRHRTLANVIGWRMMNPDEIIITNGSTGETYQVDEEELLQAFRDTRIIRSERIPPYEGYVRCIALVKGKWDKVKQICPWKKDAFRINNRVYYVDSEDAARIRKIIQYPEELFDS